MNNIRQAIDDLIDAADILVRRQDCVENCVAMIPAQSIRRLNDALVRAKRTLRGDGYKRRLIYLASPYSHPDPTVREKRYHDACKAVVRLIQNGGLVYSPIVHSHPLALQGLPTDWEYWREFDMAMLSRAEELVVLVIDGWWESEGVQAEIRAAEEMGIPVRYIEHGSRGRD